MSEICPDCYSFDYLKWCNPCGHAHCENCDIDGCFDIDWDELENPVFEEQQQQKGEI